MLHRQEMQHLESKEPDIDSHAIIYSNNEKNTELIEKELNIKN